MPTQPFHRFLRRDGIYLAIYFLLAIGLTYPLVLHLDTHQPGHGVDDPALSWALWWVRYALFDIGENPLRSDFVFYPLGTNLVAYTPAFLNGVLSIPVQFLFNVVAAQNATVYFALVTSAYGAMLLTREIVARNGIDTTRYRKADFAAMLAGAFYGFGAWHINFVFGGNFFLLSNQWIPFFILFLFRTDKRPIRNAIIAGLFVVFTAWTEMTFALFLAMFTVLYAIYRAIPSRLSFRAEREISDYESEISRRQIPPSRNDNTANLKNLLATLIVLGIVSVVGVSPLILNLVNDTLRYGYYLASGVGRVQIFSAEPISFFVPPTRHAFLGSWVSTFTEANTNYAFIGYTVLVLVIVGIIARRQSRETIFFAALAIFFALVMLGSTIIVSGQSTGIPMPFALLRQIPFVNANRYPVRFNVMLMLSLVPLIAFGAWRVLQARRGTLILGVMIPLFLLEQLLIPMPLADLRVPEIFKTISNEPGNFAILDLPLGWRGSIVLQGAMDDKAQFYQTVHHKFLLGGITSRYPAFRFQYYRDLPVINSLIALEEGREVDENRRALDLIDAPAVLRFFNIRYVVVNRALTDDALMQYALDTFPLDEIYRDDTRIVYRVSNFPAPPGNLINLNEDTARLYFDDRWGRAQYLGDSTAYRWATDKQAGVWLPLEQRSQTIPFRLRGARAKQELIIRVNGEFVAEIQLSAEWENYPVSIPRSVLRDGLNEFTFSADTFTSDQTRWDYYAIGDTSVVSPVDISATGAGYNAGRFGEIFVGGKNVIENRRGYHLVAINPQTGAVERVGLFDTFADKNESTRLAQFIAALPNGEILAGVAIDEVSSKLQQEAIDALHALGVEADLRFEFRAGHAFIGVKGAQTGQAVERVDGRFPANVSVGKNVASDRVSFALSRIEMEPSPR